ncbi:glutamine amidotransferase [Geminicoccus harenae]|uniref:glutamine amidotransferase n=1 Tax=Geminicoccus harenae TaxID=2498453 RepID=UPI00168AAC26|nr:glutamine amidotransferase [Geminicoccus harenae]
MSKKNVLLAGESWSTSAVHTKGFDQFNSTTFHLGAEPLVKALADSEFALRYMPSHEAQTAFPLTLEDLQRYDAVILSDIGANSLLLHPDVWLHGKTVPNRLKLLRDYVEMGGGLFMIGGYLSFQGINGAARYGRTAVEEVLPVTCLQVDDRIEIPEGFAPEIVEPGHPILAGLPSDWPVLLGINEVVVKNEPGVQLLARTPADQGSHPLLVAGGYGQGRTLAWTSDIGPHWLPETFVQWPGYGQLWRQCLAWLTGKA